MQRTVPSCLRSLASILSAVCAVAVVSPTAQESAIVSGRVEIGIPIASRRPSAAYTSRAIAAPTLAPESERRNVVVYRRDAPAQAVSPIQVAIRQEHERFLPRVVAVTVGSDVEFPNDDPIYHNVFSLSRVGTFNLGRYPRGETRSVRFDEPGVVKVFCDIHSHMSATVMIFDHPWFVVPDEAGRFALPAMPEGNQQITAWHARLGDTTVGIDVESGQTNAADFALPVPEE